MPISSTITIIKSLIPQMSINVPPSCLVTMACLRCIVLLIPLLTAAPALAKDFWSIDCGSNESFVTFYDLTFEPDTDYVRSGMSHAVSSAPKGSLSTLRAFPQNKKNCYTIPVGKAVKVLVRARFFYGNYDGKGEPPEFWLQFDSNPWSLVSTTMDTTALYEIVYVTKRNDTSICLGEIENEGIPFISSIEVKRLRPTMYSEGGMDYSIYALHSLSTTAYNGADESFRHPNDTYDRVWDPQNEGYTFLKNNATSINTTGLNGEPPEKLFEFAAAPLGDTITNLTINTDYLAATLIKRPIYVTMYFTEVSNIAGTSKNRSFNIYMDGMLLRKQPVLPMFGVGMELARVLFNATNNTVFELVPTNDSTLPPIISGMEVFRRSNPLNNGTSENDVDALSLLQNKFEVLQAWSGDPCLPQDYNWEWVRCSSVVPPRIINIFLNGYNLSGNLPDFSDLDALQTIDFSNNKFSGSIPEFLAKFPNLKALNLSDNDFSFIPASLSSNQNILVNLTGNPKLCNPSQPCFTGSSHVGQLTRAPAPALAPAPAPSEANKLVSVVFGWLCFVSFMIAPLV